MAKDISLDNYFYDGQFRKHIIQFMAVFTVLKVSAGKNDNNSSTNLIEVPIAYGSRDRVVSYIFSEQTQNKPLRLPCMSAQVVGIDLARDRLAGQNTERREVKLKRGGVIPDDLQSHKALKPVPYEVQMELAINTTSTEHHFQILEQILLLFNPSIQLQMSDNYGNQQSVFEVFLQNVGLEENYPTGTDKRIISSTLTFNFVMYLKSPINLKNDIIKQINLRIGAGLSRSSLNLENVEPLTVSANNWDQS